jgi:nicotinamide-nucleotide amidase
MKPMLKQVCELLGTVLDDRVYSTGYKLVGTGESSLEEGMKDIYQMDEDVLVAPYASVGEIKYVFSSKNEVALGNVSQFFESKYGDYIYGNLEDTLEGVVVKLLTNKGLTISMAESCTGGLLASRIVNVSGASTVFNESFITYSNASKMKRLNVRDTTLNTFGAVSEQCAKEMVEGLYQTTKCDVCVSITGIAGPTGGTKDKPVGLIYFGLRLNNQVKVHQRIFNGNREMIRYRATQYALNLVRKGLIM